MSQHNQPVIQSTAAADFIREAITKARGWLLESLLTLYVTARPFHRLPTSCLIVMALILVILLNTFLIYLLTVIKWMAVLGLLVTIGMILVQEVDTL